MGGCIGKQTNNKSSTKKVKSNQSDYPVFEESPTNKHDKAKVDEEGSSKTNNNNNSSSNKLPTVNPSSNDLHLLNTTTHNTLTPHVGPQIMITGATPFASSTNVSAINESNKENDSNGGGEEDINPTSFNQVDQSDLSLKSISGKYLSQNGKFIEMVDVKSTNCAFLLVNSETGVQIQTKNSLHKDSIIRQEK